MKGGFYSSLLLDNFRRFARRQHMQARQISDKEISDMSYKRIFLSIVTLSLLLTGLALTSRTAKAEPEEVTVTVQRPADVTFAPQAGAPADIIITFLVVDDIQNAKTTPPRIAYAYLRNLQVAHIDSVQGASDGSQTYLITFSVDSRTARLLTWTRDSLIPLRFTQNEVF